MPGEAERFCSQFLFCRRRNFFMSSLFIYVQWPEIRVIKLRKKMYINRFECRWTVVFTRFFFSFFFCFRWFSLFILFIITSDCRALELDRLNNDEWKGNIINSCMWMSINRNICSHLILISTWNWRRQRTRAD